MSEKVDSRGKHMSSENSGGASVFPLVSNVNFWPLARLCSGRIELAKNDVAILSSDFFILFSEFQITAQIVPNDSIILPQNAFSIQSKHSI